MSPDVDPRVVSRKVAWRILPLVFVLYIIAYLDGTKAQVTKLDPIRGSEGVGRGTVGFNAAKFFKSLNLSGPLSFVVDVDNKVKLVTVGSGVADLDARDAKVKALSIPTKPYATAWLNMLGELLYHRRLEADAILYDLERKAEQLAEKLEEDYPECAQILKNVQSQ